MLNELEAFKQSAKTAEPGSAFHLVLNKSMRTATSKRFADKEDAKKYATMKVEENEDTYYVATVSTSVGPQKIPVEVKDLK